MLRSKHHFLVSELLGYQVYDRSSKMIGKVTDLLLNPVEYNVEYIQIDKKYSVPLSLITSDNAEKRKLKLSQDKTTVTQEQNNPLLINYMSYSQLKKIPVYDREGTKLGTIVNIIRYTGLKNTLLIGAERRFRMVGLSCYEVPVECLDSLTKEQINLSKVKEELKTISLTDIDTLCGEDREAHPNKKRYVIVEACKLTAKFYINQREESLEGISQSLYIEELDVSKQAKILTFSKLYNTILAASPDTYIPISTDDVKKYFSQGAFIAYQYHKMVGYSFVNIQKEQETGSIVGTIAGIGVSPEHRGKKISLALIDNAINYLINKQVDKIQADIYEQNVPSLKLFSSLGFKEVGEVYLT
ncbi:MAG: GNAT family N-acetyltransferase [Candidatus Hodarchaeota archaeon]